MDAPVLPAPAVESGSLRRHRLDRTIGQMASADISLLVLTNPASLRYVADWREYAMFQSRIPTYYLFVRPDGRLIMHGAYTGAHPTIDEFRPADYLSCFDAGLDPEPTAAAFANSILAEIGPAATVAVDRLAPSALAALQQAGLRVIDAEPHMERARSIKSEVELECMRHSIGVAEAALAWMRSSLQPGMSENELWSMLHQTNIANDGDWIDGRMLVSGPRTNPWYQEASGRHLQEGELVALDTDMIGPFGYCADISRTWLVGTGAPSAAQRDRYQRAHAEIMHNAALLGPGVSFRELSEKAYRQEEEFVAHRYACLAHGVGMTDEYPKIYYRQDWDRHGYDGLIEPSMVLSVESFVGSDKGGPGVKLEEMYLVTDTGAEPLSTFPFEPALLS